MSPDELDAALDVVEWGERTKVAGAKSALRAHIAALEKARDAASAREFGVMVTNSRQAEEMDRLRAERDAVLADNAELLEVLRVVGKSDGAWGPQTCTWCGCRVHADRCPIGRALSDPHPSAALLEEVDRLRQVVAFRKDERDEHRKALVRARNEGREEAASKNEARARQVEAARRGLGGDADCCVVELREQADEIRATKEPEQCTDASCAKCRNGEPCH